MAKQNKAKKVVTKNKTKAILKSSKPIIKGVSAANIAKASKRIRPIVGYTPLERSNGLSTKYKANVHVKHEEA